MNYILIVEDNPGVRRMLVEILAQQYPRCQVEIATRITSAHNLLLHQMPYDLVIVDGRLPDGDGSALVEATYKAFGGPPFLGISGDPEALEDLGMAGCRAVLEKPFTAPQLLQAIEGIFHSEEAADANQRDADAA